jgi:adhesin/invasin
MTSTITARVIVMGNPVSGETLIFTDETPELGGILSSTTATTDVQGYATVTFSPGTKTGTAIITADWGILTEQTTISINSGDLSLSAESPVAANSTMTSTITAKVALNGNPIPGEIVTFSTDALPSLGALSSNTSITNDEGEAIITFTPGTDTGIANITAKWGTLNQSTSVTISIGEISIVQTLPPTITANSTMTSEIMAQLLIEGTPVANASITFSTNSTQATLSPVIAQTDVLGMATTTLYPGTIGENVEVKATWENYTDYAVIVIEEQPQ